MFCVAAVTIPFCLLPPTLCIRCVGVGLLAYSPSPSLLGRGSPAAIPPLGRLWQAVLRCGAAVAAPVAAMRWRSDHCRAEALRGVLYGG